jgi:hypothetical protein
MITRYDPKTLKKLWGGSEARASIDGPQMAAVGDVKDVDGEEYESLGTYETYRTKGDNRPTKPLDMSDEEFKKAYKYKDYRHEEKPGPNGSTIIEKWQKRARPMS